MIESSPLDQCYLDNYRSGSIFFRSLGIRIRIQGLDYQKLYNFTVGKKSYFQITKVAIFWSLALRRTFKVQEKTPALKRKQTALQNVTFCVLFFSLFEGPFSPGSGSGSSRPNSMHIHSDPNTDPQQQVSDPYVHHDPCHDPFQLNKVK